MYFWLVGAGRMPRKCTATGIFFLEAALDLRFKTSRVDVSETVSADQL